MHITKRLSVEGPDSDGDYTLRLTVCSASITRSEADDLIAALRPRPTESVVWWMAPCSGPYTEPCLTFYDRDVSEHNLRLYQWCPRCLSELSIKLGGESADPAERLPSRPPLVKAEPTRAEADALIAALQPKQPAAPVATIHGRDCPKVVHLDRGSGYLHSPTDDDPYDVDGVLYCGRCHGWLGANPLAPKE